MTPPTRPTALTEEELIHVENLEKVVHEQGVWTWWARESLAIIHRLDARVGELEQRNQRLQETLALYEGPHVTMAVSYANELENAERERDALLAVLDREVPGWREGGIT